MESFQGVITDIIFSNETNGYTVARIKSDDYVEVITGIIPGISAGENIEVTGDWSIHEIYGRQFVVKQYSVVMPTTETGIVTFLSSGVISGIGEKMATRIVERFGTNTLEIIQHNPEKLLEVQGIGAKKIGPIVESFRENLGVKNIIISLHKFGISPRICIKIYRKFGANSLDTITQNPYCLIDSIVGIGFKMADDIASMCGIEKNSPFRLEQGVLHVLKNAMNDGHMFLPENILLDEATRILGVEYEVIESTLYDLALDRKAIVEKYGDFNIVYLNRCYHAEVDVCSNLIELISTPVKPLGIDLEKELENFQEDNDILLAENQKNAVRAAFNNGVMVLTGGPGTGKTTTINTIIELLKKNREKVVLAAPTGRAAKRMTETTGEEAKTIHRLLEMAFDADDRVIFIKNDEDPIDADVIIVDEASMIDIFLMDNLLKAMKSKTRLIIVGDADQLPSVGAGNVLGDIISSDMIEIIRLNEIFRQAQESDIVLNAHRINKGKDIVANKEGTDFFFINRAGDSGILSELKSLVSGRLNRYYNLDSLKDIQVLAPMRKGDVGVTNLNSELQEILNPRKNEWNELKLTKRTFRVGDKVMQIKNNYSKEWENERGTNSGEGVYNGDIGYIYHIDKSSKEMYIVFDEFKIYKYSFDELDEIEHCFCTTIHKSQGSEFPAIIIPISWGPPKLMNRNLIYTAVTRAKNLVVIVGEKKYLDYMISNNTVNDRYTNLGYRLRKYRMNNMLELDY